MSWKSGISVAIDVWKAIQPLIPEESRVEVANRLVEVFQNHDCDSFRNWTDLVEASERSK